MTNFERYFSEIKEIVFRGNKVAKDDSGIRPCIDLECDECDFASKNIGASCSALCIQWMCEEYKEPIKLTAKEKAFLSIVETGWIARDKSGSVLYWYSKKPERRGACFSTLLDGNQFFIHKVLNLFNFIKWEDEPYSVEEMLKWEVVND